MAQAVSRGRISGTEPDDGWQIVRATAPEAKMQRFALDLRSITQGRGSFHMEFSHYAEVPHANMEKIVAQAKAQKEAPTKTRWSGRRNSRMISSTRSRSFSPASAT